MSGLEKMSANFLAKNVSFSLLSQQTDDEQNYFLDNSSNKKDVFNNQHFYEEIEAHSEVLWQKETEITTIGKNSKQKTKQIWQKVITTTTPKEITPEEKANGVIKKETSNYAPPGLFWSMLEAHCDKYTYDDNSELTNYYDKGSEISRQKEVFYSENTDPDNPKTGDKRYEIKRIYNEDGSYVEIIDVTTYGLIGDDWGKTLESHPWNYRAFDANGNQIDANSAQYKAIVQKGLTSQLPGMVW